MCLSTIAIMSFTSKKSDEVVTISVEEGGAYDLDAYQFRRSLESEELIEIPILNSGDGNGSGKRLLTVVCPGTGRKCMVEVTERGETVSRDAHKDKNGPSVLVKVVDGDGGDAVSIDWK